MASKVGVTFQEMKKTIFTSNCYCAVIIFPKKVKFCEVGKSSADFYFNPKWHSSVKKYNFLKIIFDCEVTMTSSNTYDSHQRGGIDRTKFHVCTPNRFVGVSRHIPTYAHLYVCPLRGI